MTFRERRIQLLQEKALDAFTAKLTSLTAVRTVDEIPGWALAALAAVRRMDAVPDAVLPLEVDDTELRQWVSGFLVESGIGDRFYLSTGIARFPWLEVVATGPSWLDDLGRLPVVLSGDRMTLVVVYEEEYRYEAFRRFMVPPAER